MLSRIAENLYWLGRYAERAENTARAVSVNTYLVLDLPRGLAAGWQPLVSITGQAALFADLYAEPSERNVVRFLVADERHPGSILSSLRMVRENARTMREILPREAWELVNEMYLHARDDAASGVGRRGRHLYLTAVIRGAQTLAGMLLGTMSHDEALDFILAGQMVERADMTTRILDVRSDSLLRGETPDLLPFETIQWVSVLKSLSAYQMYRRKLQTRVRRAAALRFLLQDDEFPRAVYRCLVLLEEALAGLPRNEAVLRIAGRLERALGKVDVERLVAEPDELHGFLDEVQLGLGDLHGEVARTYFPVAEAPRAA